MEKDIRKPFRYPKIPLKSNEGGRKRAKAKDTKGTLRRIWSYVAEKRAFNPCDHHGSHKRHIRPARTVRHRESN